MMSGAVGRFLGGGFRDAADWLICSGTPRLLLGVAAGLLVLRLTRARHPWLHRCVWGAVLIQSLLWAPVVLPVAVLPPAGSGAELDATAVRPLISESGVSQSPEFLAAHESSPVRWRGRHWIWPAGFLLVLATFLASHVLIRWSLRRSAPARPAWQGELDRLTEEAGLAAIPLLVHAHLGPMLVRRARDYVISVPRSVWSGLTPAEREAVLLHELAHCRRRDVWSALAIRLAAACHWFNPLAWWVVARFDEAAEWACDAAVESRGRRPAVALASSLLKLSQPAPLIRLGVSSARGSRVGIRVRRLVGETITRESTMKKMIVALLACGILATGLIRLQLVAQDAEPARTSAAVPRAEVDQLGAGLAASPDALAKQLGAALQTEGGRVVLSDALAKLAAEGAGGDVVQAALQELFVVEGGKASLKPGNESLRDEMLLAGKASVEDLKKITAACQKLADDLQGDDDTTQLVKRFLTEPAGPSMLYMLELRKRMRPDQELVAATLGKALARDGDGLYRVRPAARESIDAVVAQLEGAQEAERILIRGLKLWAAELADTPSNKKIQQAAGDPLFSTMLLTERLFKKQQMSTATANKMLDELDAATIDTAEGLEFTDKARPGVDELLAKYETFSQRAAVVRRATAAFRDQVAEDDEATAGFKRLLATDFAVLAIAGNAEQMESSVDDVLRGLLAEVLVEDAATRRLQLTADEEQREKFAKNIQELFRQYRQARRRGVEVDLLAEKLSDAPLAEALKSLGGKLVIKRLVEQQAAAANRRNLQAWTEKTLHRSGDQWTVREEAREQVAEMLETIAKVRKELSTNDF